MASEKQADLAIFPELSLSGYPPDDLVLKPAFLKDAKTKVSEIVSELPPNMSVVFGYPEASGISPPTTQLEKTTPIAYNSMSLASEGELLFNYRKKFLPNYSVFDEQRLFLKGNGPYLISVISGVNVGFLICEDAWINPGPANVLASNGANLLVIINASPFYVGRLNMRINYFQELAKNLAVPIAYTNLVGAQDELVFDGGSFVIGSDGKLISLASQFQEEALLVDLSVEDIKTSPKTLEPSITKLAISIRSKPKSKLDNPTKTTPVLSDISELYNALVIATRDYVFKNNFNGALIGLSGGIDSSVVACIAAEAIGPENLTGVLMPSIYSSQASISDALELVRNLKINHLIFPINEIHQVFRQEFKKHAFELTGLADENIQSRIRGALLMALSNQTKKIVLTTGNKSESAVGYSTLYGDTAGGFAVIKDVFKTDVYKLAKFINTKNNYNIIPQNIFDKPPSAELKENQIDQDTLPEYELLDKILFNYIEKDLSAAEIVNLGIDREIVKKVIHMVDSSEYKRRQSPIGPRITPRSFGRDRRMPITNYYVIGENQQI